MGLETKRGNIGETYSRKRPKFWIWEIRDSLQRDFVLGVVKVVEG